jgi:predicted short-subunit dehydrogenase-like oxidoreductase (DUF2520 family)
LTGPVERKDIRTVQAHLTAFDGRTKQVYRLVSQKLVEIAKDKHKETDYQKLADLLEETK